MRLELSHGHLILLPHLSNSLSFPLGLTTFGSDWHHTTARCCPWGPLYTQSRARETYWPHSSLCGRKLSDPLPVLFKRLNSGWLWPRRLAVRPWGRGGGGACAPSVHFKHEPHHPRPGRVLKLLRGAWHDATAQELLSTSIHLDPGRKHRGVTYRA